MSCFCGCPDRVVQRHHAVTRQELRHIARAAKRGFGDLISDPRNLVDVAFTCHMSHHARSQTYELTMLPDSVFEFAAEVMGPGRAFNWLRRSYAGEDTRLDALLGPVAA